MAMRRLAERVTGRQPRHARIAPLSRPYRLEGGEEGLPARSDGGTFSSCMAVPRIEGGMEVDAGIFSVRSAASFTIFVAAAARAFFWLNVS